MVKRELTFKLDFKKDKFEITPQGFLKTDAFITRAGIFEYNDDRGFVRELRPSEEVFNEDSLKSLALAPLTFHHPDKAVTIDNIKLHQVGTIGEVIKRDKDFVRTTILITDKNVIDRVLDIHEKGGKIELSAGYDARITAESGTHPTEGKFDATQRDIRYNHVSIVDRGRAGKEVTLKLDEGVQKKESQKKEDKRIMFTKQGVKTGRFVMDSITGVVGEDSQPVVERLSTKLDEAVGVIQTLEVDLQAKIDEFDLQKKKMEEDEEKEKAKTDELQKKVDDFEAQVKAFSDPNSDTVKTMIKDMIDLRTVAGKLDISLVKKDEKDIDVNKTVTEIKTDVITKHVGDDVDLSGKTDVYIEARYDLIAHEVLKEDGKEDDPFKKGIASFVKDAASGKGGENDFRADFMKKSSAMHEDKEDKD